MSAKLLIAIVACSFAHAASAQELREKLESASGVSFVQGFLGHCAQNAGNNQRVIDALEMLGLPPVPDKLRPLVGPSDPNAEFQGWFESDQEQGPYFIGVSSGEIDGETFHTCAITNPYIDTKVVVAAIINLAELERPDFDETSAGQRLRVWETDDWLIGSMVMLTDAEPMNLGGATLSISAPAQR